MINLLNISKDYGKNHAVKSIDLTMETGKTTVLIGPSGCGKSTILRIIIGLTAPDKGEVLSKEHFQKSTRSAEEDSSMEYLLQQSRALRIGRQDAE